MKVCIYGSEIGPLKNGVFIGGAAVSAVRLAIALHDLGDEIFIYSSSPRGEGSGVYEFDWGTVVNRRVPGQYTSLPYLFFYALMSLFGLLNYCRRNKIDVICSHSGHLILCVIPSIIGKILNIPVIHVQYCTSTFGSRGVVRFLFNCALTRAFLALPTVFVPISNNVERSLRSAGVPKNKLKVIPPLVFSLGSGCEFKYEYRRALGISKDDFVVLFVGNLKENKGIDVLIESLINMRHIRNLKLITTTELIHKFFKERQKHLIGCITNCGLADKVLWLGIVKDMYALIAAVDVVVVPFLNLDGISDYPLIVLEAMDAGRPVIASNIGGIREIIVDGENGILVPAGDPLALSRALQSLLADVDLRDKLASNAFEFIHKVFDAKNVAKKYRDLLLESRRTPSR